MISVLSATCFLDQKRIPRVKETSLIPPVKNSLKQGSPLHSIVLQIITSFFVCSASLILGFVADGAPFATISSWELLLFENREHKSHRSFLYEKIWFQ